MIDLAIIGGTSLKNLDKMSDLESLSIQTDYNDEPVSLFVGSLYGKRIAFLNRHGEQGSLPPHRIAYRANIDALTKAGVKNVVALNAVGGIAPFAAPLHISVPSQIIDYSYGREHSYFDSADSEVSFVDFTDPFCEKLSKRLEQSALSLNMDRSQGGFSTNTCYGCTQGPRLETRAEIKRMKQDTCDLVGMTMMPEAALAREKSLNYASVCLVVNWAAGVIEQPSSMDEIMDTIAQGSLLVESLLDDFIQNWT